MGRKKRFLIIIFIIIIFLSVLGGVFYLHSQHKETKPHNTIFGLDLSDLSEKENLAIEDNDDPIYSKDIMAPSDEASQRIDVEGPDFSAKCFQKVMDCLRENDVDTLYSYANRQRMYEDGLGYINEAYIEEWAEKIRAVLDEGREAISYRNFKTQDNEDICFFTLVPYKSTDKGELNYDYSEATEGEFTFFESDEGFTFVPYNVKEDAKRQIEKW